MATKPTRREKIARQKESGIVTPKSTSKKQVEKSSVKWSLSYLLFLIGFLVYANTLSHDYVLDDYGLIRDNNQTKLGVSAVPEIFASSYRYGMNITDHVLYRPLSKAMFAIEWSI